MSHRKLLEQRINDAIEAGHYRAKGTPRAKSSPSEDVPVPAPRAEPEKRPEPSKAEKRGVPDPQSFVHGLAARRRDSVGGAVHEALDQKFKKR
jgi:hypothetical protein